MNNLNYDAKTLALIIRRSNSNIEKLIRYKAAQDRAMELTDSCTKEECINWLSLFMSKCIEKQDWIAYIGVYDLFESVVDME